MNTIPIYQPYLQGNEKKYVNQCLDSTWISSKGEFIEKFEKSFAEYICSTYATSVCNGTVALHLALTSLGIRMGDEVIVPTLTYVASVNTIAQTGATPVFADSLADTWQIDPEEIRRKITSKTKAVMVVHLYGYPCEMTEIISLCNEHNLLLIEDCAEAFGTYYHGKHVGTFGDIATFSFFGNKTITTGEGGMVVTNDHRLHQRNAHLKSQGVSSSREYWHDAVAYNYRMTNIQAAIGLAQLEQAHEILKKKRELAKFYRDNLQNLPLVTDSEKDGIQHSYWMCSIVLNDASQRDPLRNHLAEHKIETRPFFPPAHLLPIYINHSNNYPVAESLSSRGINLPSWPGMTLDQCEMICHKVQNWFI